MNDSEKKLYAVIAEVRTCFNQLKTLAEHLHGAAGVNPSMRAVMETLSHAGALSVAELAKRKRVSRQHIQIIMNALAAAKLVTAVENPAHRRSPLFDLSEKGRKTFSAMTRREVMPLKRLAAGLSELALDQTHKTLTELNRQLNAEISKGDSKNGA
jgi:DNA-binding MarR family transcriptional regulator